MGINSNSIGSINFASGIFSALTSYSGENGEDPKIDQSKEMTHYKSGEIETAVLLEDFKSGSYLFAKGTIIELFKNKKVRGGTFADDYTIYKIEWEKGTKVIFYTDGQLMQAIPTSDIDIPGIDITVAKYKPVWFYPGGVLAWGTLDDDTDLGGIHCKEETEVGFFENGRLHRAVLSENQEIQGYHGKNGELVYFKETGLFDKIIAATKTFDDELTCHYSFQPYTETRYKHTPYDGCKSHYDSGFLLSPYGGIPSSLYCYSFGFSFSEQQKRCQKIDCRDSIYCETETVTVTRGCIFNDIEDYRVRFKTMVKGQAFVRGITIKGLEDGDPFKKRVEKEFENSTFTASEKQQDDHPGDASKRVADSDGRNLYQFILEEARQADDFYFFDQADWLEQTKQGDLIVHLKKLQVADKLDLEGSELDETNGNSNPTSKDIIEKIKKGFGFVYNKKATKAGIKVLEEHYRKLGKIAIVEEKEISVEGDKTVLHIKFDVYGIPKKLNITRPLPEDESEVADILDELSKVLVSGNECVYSRINEIIRRLKATLIRLGYQLKAHDGDFDVFSNTLYLQLDVVK